MKSRSQVGIGGRSQTEQRRTNSSIPTMIPLQRSPRSTIAFFLAVVILSPHATTPFSTSRYRRSFSLLSAVAPPEERLDDSCRIVASEDDCIFPQQDDRPTEEKGRKMPKQTDSSVDRETEVRRMEASERRRRILAADLLRRGAHSSPPSSKERVVDAVRKSAQTKRTTKVTRSVIHSAIHELMEQAAHHDSPSSSSTSLSSFVGKSIGVLGDQQDWKSLKQRTDLSKLTVLEDEATVIRMASSLDDFEIANLRLSVFADFSMQQQSQFCAYVCVCELLSVERSQCFLSQEIVSGYSRSSETRS